jgi:hypothetical protein
MDDEYFTLVFKGDIRMLGFNPMKAITEFGPCVAASIGDALERMEDMINEAERRECEAWEDD